MAKKKPSGAPPESDPDALTGKSPKASPSDVLRSNEQQRPYWESIEFALGRSIRLDGSPELRKLWKSKELRQWIMAQVERNPKNGRMTYMPPNAREHAEAYQQVNATRQTRLTEINERVSKAIDSYIEDMQDVIDAIGDGAGLPVGPDWDKLKVILENITKNKPDVNERQHGMVALVRDIVLKNRNKEQLKLQLTATLKLYEDYFGTELTDKIQSEVLQILDDATPSRLVDKKKKMLKKLGALGDIEFSTEDRTAIEDAIGVLDTELASQNEEVDLVLADVFADHTRYLRNLAGDDREAVIRSGIRDDFQFSEELFLKSVRILKTDLTSVDIAALKGEITFKLSDESLDAALQTFNLDIAKLQEMAKEMGITIPGEVTTVKPMLKLVADTARDYLLKNGKVAFEAKFEKFLKYSENNIDGFTREKFFKLLVDSWDVSAIDKFMENELKMNDTVGYSLKRMMLRARMPDEVAEFLIDGDVKIYISDLVGLSEIDPDKFLNADELSEDTAKQILKLISGTNAEVKKSRFVDVVSFTLLNEQVGGNDVNEKESTEDARKRAEELWDTIVAAGHLKNSGSGDFTVKDETEFLKALQGQAGGTRAVELQKSMNEAEIHDIKWAQATQKYVGQFMKDTWVGGGSWLEYIKDLGAIVYSPSDGAIGDLIEKRARLQKVHDALVQALQTADGSGKMIERAIKQVEDLQKEIEKLSKPLDATASIGESVEQARFLLQANAEVIKVLRADNLWDDIPNSVRQTSLWIAMNRGGSAEAGLLEAQKFLRAYHSAPRALKYYEDAFNSYTAGQTPQNLDQYLGALGVYQSISQIDEGIFNEYSESIVTYHSALMLTPESMKEDGMSVKAKKDDGTDIFGKVTKILDATNTKAVRVQLEDGSEATFDFDAYKTAFVTGMTKRHTDAANAYRAASAAHEATKDPRDPASTAYDQFINAYMAGGVPGLNPITAKEKTHLLRYRRKIETVVEIKGSNNLSGMFHAHGLYLRPAAVMALSESKTNPRVAGTELPEVSLTNGSYSVDKWLAQGHREFADEPLRIVVGGPPAARDALIQAYIEKRDVEYPVGKDKDGKVLYKTITSEQAFKYVSEFKRLLQWQSEQHHPALEELSEDELFKDPIEGGFRAMVETMQDMWAGDTVNKAMVVGAVIAAVWLVRHIWKKGGEEGAGLFMKMAKMALIGLPLLMVANAAYKSRTGRDILGEKLLYMSKSKRNGILEQWRRRSAKYDLERYGILTHPAGFAAMQELMRKENSVPIKDLHQWRMSVKDDGTGYNNYLNGIPAGINLSQIQWRLGNNASKEEAAKVAYMTYEALCVDVAAMHNKTSGNIQTRANWGSDYIFREYHLASSYAGVAAGPGKDGPTLQDKIRGRNPSMLDVMIAEAHLPSLKNSVVTEETTVERIANLLGWTKEKVQRLVVKGYTKVEIMALGVAEKAPDWWEGAKEWTFDTYEDVEKWMKIRGIIVSKVLVDNFWASLKAIQGLGVTVMEVAPGVIEFVVDGTIEISASVLRQLKDTHDSLVKLPPEMNYVEAFEEWVLKMFGFDVIAELGLSDARKQMEVDMVAESSFWDGGTYPTRDVKRRISISQSTKVTRSDKLLFEDAARDALSAAEVRDKIEGYMRDMSGDVYNITIAPEDKIEDKLTPAQQRYLLDIIRVHMMRVVGFDTTLQQKIAQYEADILNLETQVKDLGALAVSSAATHRATKRKKAAAYPDFRLAWEAPEDTIRAEYDVQYSLLESFDQAKADAVAQKAIYSTEKAAAAAATGGIDRWNKSRLDGLIRDQQSIIDQNNQKINDTDTRVKQLVVRIKLSQMIAANRNPADAAALAFSDVDANLVLLPRHQGDATEIGNVKTRLDFYLAQAIAEHAAYKALEALEVTQGTTAAEKKREHGEAKTKLAEKLASGMDSVIIDTADLFPAAIAANALSVPVANRKAPLLSQVFNEPYNVAEFVPMEWLLGDAREKAQKMITAWKDRRMENDKTLQAYISQGKDLDAVASYERLLEHIALSETFQRAMMQSADGGLDERKSPLHLSVKEARTLDEYLKERERLISFAQFLEIWEEGKDQPGFLP